MCREAKHRDFFKKNRYHNTSFTHKHRDLPWKPLTGKTRKPWSHTSYFLFITLWILTIQNIGIQMRERTFAFIFKGKFLEYNLQIVTSLQKHFFIPSLGHKLKCLTMNLCSTLYFWEIPTRPNKYSFDS